MRLLLLLFMMFFISVAVQPAEAQVPSFKTANDLVQICQGKKVEELQNPTSALAFGFCHGIFQGLLASSAVSEVWAKPLKLGNPLFCAPPGVTPGQARKIFLKWMDEHPEDLHENPMVEAIISLMKAFPCQSNG